VKMAHLCRRGGNPKASGLEAKTSVNFPVACVLQEGVSRN